MTEHKKALPIGEVQHRPAMIEKDGFATRAKGDERIPISISSEEPVDRWFGREVLVHSKEAINLDHATEGLPFLADHETARQLGLVEDVSLRKDGKLGGYLRKGNHPDSGWVFADIEAGIRKNISVGYQINELKLDETGDAGDTYRALNWTPLECSTVSVPADITVGVGRGRQDSMSEALARIAKTAKEGIDIPIRFTFAEDAEVSLPTDSEPRVSDDAEMVTNPNLLCAVEGCGHPALRHPDDGACNVEGCICPGYEPTDQANDHAEPRSTSPALKAKERSMSEQDNTGSAETAHKAGTVAVTLQDKQKETADIARLAREHGMEEHMAGWFDRGLSKDQVSSEILSRTRGTRKPVDVPGYLGMSEREASQFKYTRAIQAMMSQTWERDGGFEKEVSDAVAKRTNRSTAGMFIPLDLPVMTRTAITGNVAGTSSLGGAGVQTSVLSLIDLLRNKMLVRQLGATVLSGLSGNITFPRHIVANTMAWEGENPSTPHANSAATFDNVALSPRTAMASSSYSRQLLIQESFDVSAFIQNDLATVLALGLDLAALDGLGSANQPTGIMRQTGVTVITHTGSNGGIPTWAEMVSYETNVATNNADIGKIAWVTTPGLRGKLKTVLKSTTAGSSYIWADDQTINGYPAFVTAQMPSNFTFGTATTVAHGVAFGVWSEVLIGEWGGALEVIIDPYTQASQGMVAITQLLLADIGVRHPKAFAITKSALIA